MGWAVWEWPRVFIEAEFHAVWKHPDGLLLDIAPRQFSIPRVLPLPDPKRIYTGRQVGSIRLPLCNDKTVKRFCEVSALIHKELNTGALADVYGGVKASEKCVRYPLEKERVLATLLGRYGLNHPRSFT